MSVSWEIAWQRLSRGLRFSIALCLKIQIFRQDSEVFISRNSLNAIRTSYWCLLHSMGDEAKAVSYYQESYLSYPCNLDVLCWLAAFYVKNEMYEKALEYFKLASQLQPTEIKWSLMVASCYRYLSHLKQLGDSFARRAGLLPEAFEYYAQIHQGHPESVECLRFLVQLCDELGKGQSKAEFEEKLRQSERTQTLLTQNQSLITQRDTPLKIKPEKSATLFIPPLRADKAKPVQSLHADDWGEGALGEDLLPL